MKAVNERNSQPKSANRDRQVFIVLLNWQQWELTVACLMSLQALDYDDWKVIVLDNGSDDDSVERIQEKCPYIEVVELGENLGFARGNNAGIRLALERGAEYVWLLNNDTTVDPLALRALVAKAEADPTVGAVGSAIYDASDSERLQVWGGGRVNFWLGRSRGFLHPASDEKLEFLSGASLLLRRAVLESIGLFDEGFFFYWEDTDYCFRLRQAGWRLAVAPESKIWHKESASVGKTSTRLDNLFNTSAARFFEKHACAPRASLWIGVTLRVLKRIVRGRWSNAWAAWSAARQARFRLRNPRGPQRIVTSTFESSQVGELPRSLSETRTNK
jgi:GT2 family glycosyltransferase